jgi:hypothetical protein
MPHLADFTVEVISRPVAPVNDLASIVTAVIYKPTKPRRQGEQEAKAYQYETPTLCYLVVPNQS